MSWIYFDQTFVPEEDAKISVMDRGFLCGDGVYTTIQVREGQPLFLNVHLKRLIANCKELKILPPHIPEEVIEQLIEKNTAQKGIWRLKILITGGKDPVMRLPERTFGHLIITLKPFSPPADIPLKLGCFPIPVSLCHASFKSLAHLNRYYVMEYAHERGLDDAVTFTESGVILEASFGNLLWIDEINQKAWTPESALPLHTGITISVLTEILEKEGYVIERGRKKLLELPMVPLFRVNTMSGIRSVASLGELALPLSRELELTLRGLYQKEAEQVIVTA